jgi:hypothetical protein
VNATESGVLRVIATASGSATAPTIRLEREKKEKPTAKLETFVSARAELYKKDGLSLKDEKSATVSDYADQERNYVKDELTVREIVFATKNYFYIVSVSPGQSEYSAVVDELIKSITIQ